MNTSPAHLHLLINHLPLTGLFVAVVVLVVALLMKNRMATILGLCLVGLLAGSAWAVIETGEDAYTPTRELADEDGKVFLKQHMRLADRLGFVYYITAGASLAALLAGWKWPRAFTALAALTALMALISLAAGAAIADAGGKIRHSEFRQVDSTTNASPAGQPKTP